MNITELANSILVHEDLPQDSTEAIDFAVSKAVEYILGQLDARVIPGASYEAVIAEIKSELNA